VTLFKNAAEVTYHGYSYEDGAKVIHVEDAHGAQIGVVPHLLKHSPSGMNWGYAGSGPSDTARSLFIAALGEGAVCTVCAGTRRVVYVSRAEGLAAVPFDPDRHLWSRRGWRCKCDDGYTMLPYLAFVDQFVSQWGREWMMTRVAVLMWLEQHQGKDHLSDHPAPTC